MPGSPLLYSPSFETFRANEAETISGLNDAFDSINETTASDYGHAVRAVHAKAHGILRGEMLIAENLSPILAQGLFANAGRRHPVYLRISTNAGDLLPDTISLPRGVALKVVGVEGARLPGSEGDNQDFLMVNGPVFQAPNAEKFLSSLKLLAKTTDRMEGAKKVLSAALRGTRRALETVGLESTTVNALGGAPNAEPFGQTYFSVTPFRYGDYVAKFSLRPATAAMQGLKDKEIDIDGRENAIREDLRSQSQSIPLEWDFCVQLCRDIDKQPIEDPTIEWKEDEAPFEKVATVRVAPQDSWEPGLVASVDEAMRFSVWTGISSHRPLGNINRARRETYRHSADFRARFNGCPYHEPSQSM